MSGCRRVSEVDTALGQYELRIVDGDPLPWVVRIEGDMVLRGVSALLQIDPDGCRLDATYQATFAGVPAEPGVVVDLCTWSQTGPEVSFVFVETGLASLGILAGRLLTITNTVAVFEYRRID